MTRTLCAVGSADDDDLGPVMEASGCSAADAPLVAALMRGRWGNLGSLRHDFFGFFLVEARRAHRGHLDGQVARRGSPLGLRPAAPATRPHMPGVEALSIPTTESPDVRSFPCWSKPD